MHPVPARSFGSCQRLEKFLGMISTRVDRTRVVACPQNSQIFNSLLALHEYPKEYPKKLTPCHTIGVIAR